MATGATMVSIAALSVQLSEKVERHDIIRATAGDTACDTTSDAPRLSVFIPEASAPSDVNVHMLKTDSSTIVSSHVHSPLYANARTCLDDYDSEEECEMLPACYLGGKRAMISVDEGSVTVLHSVPVTFGTFGTRMSSLGPGLQGINVPLSELAAVSMRQAVQQTISKLCGGNDSPSLILHTFKKRGSDWIPNDISVDFDEDWMAELWVQHTQSYLDAIPERPRRLFVVMNPFGGARQADLVWSDVAKPIFERSRIKCDANRTGYRDHALELLADMSWEQFSGYDGIVAVGGDGLFQECLRGVLAQRAKGGAWRDHARQIRIAQIPAGSTDAVACTVNGSRSPHAAALHVVLGDRLSLDVLEVRTPAGGQRYACSTASYGFIGDVLDRSENMRWMGPVRYDISGAFTFLRLNTYPVRIYYKQPVVAHHKRSVCRSTCQLCSQPQIHAFDSESELSIRESATSDSSAPVHSRAPSGDGIDVPTEFDEIPAADANVLPECGGGHRGSHTRQKSEFSWFSDLNLNSQGSDTGSVAGGDDGRWKVWEGEISCLMAVVTSTRSDKSKAGLIPHAHLSDGKTHLVIVRKCSRMQFFRFLLSLTRKGVDESLDFVDVKEVEAWRLEPLDKKSQQSYWNVDGELMRTDYMSARCHHGLIEVFGRGPDL